jgi:hypothetical protein
VYHWCRTRSLTVEEKGGGHAPAKRMLIDVGDSFRNAVLNGSFYAIALGTALATVPWGMLGASTISRLLRWLVVPVAVLAVTYETAMPPRYDIRLDLALLGPMYLVVMATSALRWFRWSRRADGGGKRDESHRVQITRQRGPRR